MSNIKMRSFKEAININNKEPALVVDGNLLSISSNGVGELVFFQVDTSIDSSVEATGIGTYRMPLSQLEALKTTIENAITVHAKKYPLKK